jgi:hypothetical protein
MNLRKLKKIASPGNVYTIIGTHTAFMSLGGFKRTEKGLSPIGINGIDLFARKVVTRMDGRCRPATKKESDAYWNILKQITNNLLPGDKICSIAK